ncbi:class I SAM-dependent methyltransferase [candidate division KSB1 bacterium]|nr:class I SAM-dependent methyltransferase [bacterium]NUM64297.1 class I SAM-dependent methyltransferase [candidate division KSB1 bacterium]
MHTKTNHEVHEYFRIAPELLPYLPELFADLWAIGSAPEIIVAWLRRLGLPPRSTRAIDLGCGKGAVAITLAKELNYQIFGFDFFEPFVLAARQKAQEPNVAELCTFTCADMRHALNSASNYDLAIYTAVGDVLGSVAQCVGRLREAIHPHGYMIIDDGFRLTNDPIAFPGYEYYASHEETIHQLTAHGDKILQEKIFSVAEMKQVNQRNTAFITQSASAIVKSHPELADALSEFLEQERQECEILERDVACAMWLIEKA